MPYVKRDENGAIAAAYRDRRADATEYLAGDDAELAGLVAPRPEDPRRTLTESDLEMVRVIEDLIAVLMHKNLIQATDLPVEARAKLFKRRRLRSEMDRLVGLVAEDETI